MNPTITKLVFTVLAAGLYVLAEQPSLAGVRDLLVGLAGGLVGGAFLRRPGDLKGAQQSLPLE